MCCWKRMFAVTSAFSWQKSIRYCPGSFVPQGQTCLLLEISLDFLLLHLTLGFPDSSVGKESACNAGDPGSIPGSGRSTGERIGYPLQYSWASPVAQLVKNLLALRRPGFDPWVGKIPWRRERLSMPAFWPGEFRGPYSS